jgi:hypothetical protein
MTRSPELEDSGACSTVSPPDQLPHAPPQLVQFSDSYMLPVVWQLAQNVVSPASMAAWFGAVSAPQAGQFGADGGRNRGVITLAQTLHVNMGRASEVILTRNLFRLILAG